MRVWEYMAVALAVAMGPAAPANAQQTVSKAEVRQQDPSITDAQLRDQLWGLFRKEDRRSASSPTQPLAGERFVTTPYPAGAFGTSGLCRMDVLAMKFAPTQGLLRNADAATPMRAYGLESSTRFLILPLLPEERGDVFDDKWNGPCARLGQDDPRFFRAVSGEAARKDTPCSSVRQPKRRRGSWRAAMPRTAPASKHWRHSSRDRSKACGIARWRNRQFATGSSARTMSKPGSGKSRADRCTSNSPG